MATAHRKRSKKKRSRKFKRPTRGVVHDEAFAIDYSKLPRALDAEALAALEAEWSDLGSWQALAEVLPADEDGNVDWSEQMEN